MLEVEMEIKLGILHDGVNEFHIETTAGELGFEKDDDTWLLFPEKISVYIEVQKQSDRYYIKTKLLTTAHFLCDRCLDDFTQEIKSSFQLYYLKSFEDKVSDNSYRFLSANTNEIDMTEDVIENLLLAVPMKKLCKEDCSGLCANCGVNLNKQKCSCKRDEIDPRWAKLKNLK